MKKTLSLFLAVLMILAAMPVVFAATELTVDNIAELPTAVGEMFYGQTLADVGMTLEGGKVTVDGTDEGEVIDGTFEFVDTSARPVVGGTAQVKFVPADTETYTAIETEVAVTVKKTTPIYSALPVLNNKATLNKGLALVKFASATGTFSNPYSGEILQNAKWVWKSNSVIVKAPGLQTAKGTYGTADNKNYEYVYVDVWVSIEGVEDSLFPTIVEYPTFTETVRYDLNKTWGDYTLTGGKATVKDADGNEIEAKGTFVVSDTYKTVSINKSGETLLYVNFISNDETVAASIPFTMKVTVEKALPAWTTGETLVLNYDYGDTPFGQYGDRVDGLDARNINCYDAKWNPYNDYQFMLYNADNEPLNFGYYYKPDVGTYNYYVKVRGYVVSTGNLDNWDTETLLPVQIVVTPANAQVQDFTYSYISGEIKGNYGNLYLNGTVDITIGNKTIENVAVKQGRFTANWTPADTKNDADYDVTVKYTKADGDNAVVESDYTRTINYKTDRNINLKHKQIDISTKGNPSFINENDYLITGTAVTIRATRDDFVYWEITDANGKEIELDITDGKITDKTFTFTMPAYDITINAVFQYQLDQQAKLESCECLCHSDNAIAKFFWNIILKIMDIFSQFFGYESLCDCGFAHGTTNAF